MKKALFLLSFALLGGVGSCAAPSESADVNAPFSTAEREAFELTAKRPIDGLRLMTPGDGAVIPWSFPSVEMRWEDRFAADAFRLRVVHEREGALEDVVVEAWTSQRYHQFSDEQWQNIRTRAGEGGSFIVELAAASVLPDGELLRGPSKVRSQVRFSGSGEHPTGHVYYSLKARPPGAPPGPMGYERRLLIPMRVAMDGKVVRQFKDIFAERLGDAEDFRYGENKKIGPAVENPGDAVPLVATRGHHLEREQALFDEPAQAVASDSYDFSSVAKAPGVPPWQNLFSGAEPECAGCHTASAGAKYATLISGFDDYSEGSRDDTIQTMYVVRSADDEILHELRGGFMPRFHPTKPNILMFAFFSNEVGNGLMASFFRSDIHVLDIETGGITAVPGASDLIRCEMFPDWTPDGESIVFSRSPEGQPCDGQQGKLEIARVPYGKGEQGNVEVLAEITEQWGSNAQPRVSPDGRWIVFYRSPRGFYSVGASDLWVVSAEGGEARPLSLNTGALESWHGFSPDGHWLVYQSNRDRVDHLKGYVARFYEDGRVAAPVPLPGAGHRDSAIVHIDWAP